MVLFKFTWKIENFSFFWRKEKPVKIYSPEFILITIGHTKWKILITDEKPTGILSSQIPTGMKFIKLYLVRMEDDSLFCINLHTEVELLKVDGSLFRPHKLGITNTHFKGNNLCIFHENISFDSSIVEIVPEDVLTINCKIYSTSTSFLEKGECLALTRASVESMDFVAGVQSISKLKDFEKLPVLIQFTSVPKQLFTAHLYQSNTGQILLSMSGKDSTHLGFCRVLICVNFENWEECGQYSEWEKHRTDCEFKLTLSFKTVMDNKEKYIRNDMMTIKCEVAFYSESVTPERIDTIQYENFPELKKEPQKLPPTLADDLAYLQKDGTLCDVKLRVNSETFPAHKAILSARSPVFKKMFTSDKNEDISDCIDIPDINSNTLSNLLMFIYTDTTAPMEWQDALNLYFVADKYEIEYLKLKCTGFLKSNVQAFNCFDLLLLSDRHKDDDLKEFVELYIVRKQEDVFKTAEWETFFKNHVELAMYLMDRLNFLN